MFVTRQVCAKWHTKSLRLLGLAYVHIAPGGLAVNACVQAGGMQAMSDWLCLGILNISWF